MVPAKPVWIHPIGLESSRPSGPTVTRSAEWASLMRSQIFCALLFRAVESCMTDPQGFVGTRVPRSLDWPLNRPCNFLQCGYCDRVPEGLRGILGKTPTRHASEREANASLGSGGAALVGHYRALDRAKHRDALAGAVVEARAHHRANGAGRPGVG